MRKLIVYEHITMDGVVQGPGGPDEDTSGGFACGGWISGYADQILSTKLREQMGKPFDLLLGRKTFQIWEPFWPHHAQDWPGVMIATKYVASNTLNSSLWQPTVFLNGDIPTQVAEIKAQPGPNLHSWGSANMLQTLLKADLVDAFWLMIYPLTLGAGKRLFAGGGIPAAFKLMESHTTSKGVIIAAYERDREEKIDNQ
ncbi:MAG: dihydrofolate reductase family protein [Anaerolineaceae bacterium]|jgi:dihydrofolate reductase|nr:dihydrofolate reductase family protein [Anaerolineaceae bacterium]MDD4042445.1 dihydrofolate reductase family protein [Anaerolineaceae bacterium]MDD4577152.1 dihydrofolate reductase family protein [Anaerolineaceae bacterium]